MRTEIKAFIIVAIACVSLGTSLAYAFGFFSDKRIDPLTQEMIKLAMDKDTFCYEGSCVIKCNPNGKFGIFVYDAKVGQVSLITSEKEVKVYEYFECGAYAIDLNLDGENGRYCATLIRFEMQT